MGDGMDMSMGIGIRSIPAYMSVADLIQKEIFFGTGRLAVTV